MDEVIICGHGPSMLMEEMGAEIDGFETVVRLKRCQETLEHPQYYGTKTDIVGGSWNIVQQLKGIGEATRYWGFIDSRHPNINDNHVKAMEGLFEPYEFQCSLEQCRYWDDIYRSSRNAVTEWPSQVKQGKHSDEVFGHNHLSQGLKALIYVGHFLKPKTVTLAGFDNVYSGQFTWSITRGPEWQQYPDHHWETEMKMVETIADYYGMQVEFLLPNEDEELEAPNEQRH